MAQHRRKWTSEVGRHLYEELTADERQKMDQLRTTCSDVLGPEHDDLFLIRFCRARNFKMDKVEAMLRAALLFCKENNVNWESWGREFGADPAQNKFPAARVNGRYGSCREFGKDRDGSPVIYAFVGRRDNIGLMRCMSGGDWARSCWYFMMALHRHRTVNCDAECEQAMWVFDVAELSLKQALHGPFLRADQKAINFLQDCLPEQLKRVIVINAPKIFTFVWAVYKHFLDKKTRDKVSIVGTNYLSALQKHIDDKEIPQLLGGGANEKEWPGLHNPAFAWVRNSDGSITEAPRDDPFIPAGLIPDTFYRDGLSSDNATELIVGRGSTGQVEIQVARSGSTLRWEFQTKDYNIAYGLYYKPADVERKLKRKQMTELIKPAQVDSHVYPVEGAHTCSAPGMYVLQFDNSFSMMRSKTVMYTVEILQPTESESKPVGYDPVEASVTAAEGQGSPQSPSNTSSGADIAPQPSVRANQFQQCRPNISKSGRRVEFV